MEKLIPDDLFEEIITTIVIVLSITIGLIKALSKLRKNGKGDSDGNDST